MANSNGKKRRDEKRRRLYEYYSDHTCVDCGESRPEVLELDHVSGQKMRTKDGKRTLGVSDLISRNYSWTMIEEEIKKCEVRCANCHRIRTVKTHGWYKDLVDYG